MFPLLALGGGMLLGGGLSLLGSKKAAKGAERAAATQAQAGIQGAEISAQAQREALQYLKEREAMPQQIRESALGQLASVYGIPMTGGHRADVRTPGFEGLAGAMPPSDRPSFSPFTRAVTGALEKALPMQAAPVGEDIPIGSTGGPLTGFEGQEGLIERARMSPLYGALIGGREAGEEAIMRQASATGGLRSGNVQEAMYDYNTRLQNQALLQSYNEQLQGLKGLAGLPSYAPQIASGMAGVGQILGAGVAGAGQATALGQQAAGQAWQQGLQGVSDIALGGLGTAFKYGVI